MPAKADRSFTTDMAGAVRAWFGNENRRAGELAVALGVSRPTATERWHGRTPYTNDDLDRIADYLGISPFDIVRTAEQMSTPAEASDEPAIARDVFAQPARSKSQRSA